MVRPRRATGKLRNVEHILKRGKNLLSIVSLHNDADMMDSEGQWEDVVDMMRMCARAMWPR
jgi:hypothetical protein